MTSTQKKISNYNENQILADIVAKLVLAYNPLQIYLFGSRARGDFRSDSDYDLLLIMPNNTAKELRTPRIAYTVLWGISVPVQILIWTKDEFESLLDIPNSLPAEIKKDGKLLHVA